MSTEESVKDTSQVSKESQESAATENTDFETDVSEFDGETISKKAFLERLGKSKEKRTAAEQRAIDLEKKLQEYSWVDELNNRLAADPKLEKQMLKLLAEERDDEEVDEVTKLKKELKELREGFVKNTEKEQMKIYASYTDDFHNTVGIKKGSRLSKSLLNAVTTVLDDSYEGWRDRYKSGLVAKAYEELKGELSTTLLNKEKKDYIDNKTKSDSPEIGKGRLGDAVDKVPYGDQPKMDKFIEDFYKS